MGRGSGLLAPLGRSQRACPAERDCPTLPETCRGKAETQGWLFWDRVPIPKSQPKWLQAPVHLHSTPIARKQARGLAALPRTTARW